jgi:hypothetical protein
VQLATTVLALGEIEPLGHARHVVTVVAAAVAEYVPDPQFVHATEPIVSL